MSAALSPAAPSVLTRSQRHGQERPGDGYLGTCIPRGETGAAGCGAGSSGEGGVSPHPTQRGLLLT